MPCETTVGAWCDARRRDRRDTRRVSGRRRGSIGWSYSGADSAEAASDGLPRVRVGVGAWEMQDDSAHRARDAHADLQQHEPQAPDLRARERGAVGAQLEFLQQHVRRGGQRDAELIGPEARAAGVISEVGCAALANGNR